MGIPTLPRLEHGSYYIPSTIPHIMGAKAHMQFSHMVPTKVMMPHDKIHKNKFQDANLENEVYLES